jgi:hypothetical protein
MRKIFIFITTLILQILSNNRAKMIIITIGVLAFFISGNVDKESITSQKVAGKFKSGDELVYFYKSQSSYISIESKDVVKISKDGCTIEYNESNVLYILSILTYIISIIVIVLFTIISDSDCEWEIVECWEIAFTTLIRCEIQDGEYCYTIFDRLIFITEVVVRRKNLSDYFSINRFSQIQNLPKFETKLRKRESLISKLGL